MCTAAFLRARKTGDTLVHAPHERPRPKRRPHTWAGVTAKGRSAVGTQGGQGLDVPAWGGWTLNVGIVHVTVPWGVTAPLLTLGFRGAGNSRCSSPSPLPPFLVLPASEVKHVTYAQPIIFLPGLCRGQSSTGRAGPGVLIPAGGVLGLGAPLWFRPCHSVSDSSPLTHRFWTLLNVALL